MEEVVDIEYLVHFKGYFLNEEKVWVRAFKRHMSEICNYRL